MNDSLNKHMLDAMQAAQAVLEFLGDADVLRYRKDRLLRSAVERQLLGALLPQADAPVPP